MEFTRTCFRNAHAFQGRIGIWKFCFLRRGENQSTWRKTSQRRVENSNKLDAHMTLGPGIEPGNTGGRQALSQLRHPCCPIFWCILAILTSPGTKVHAFQYFCYLNVLKNFAKTLHASGRIYWP